MGSNTLGHKSKYLPSSRMSFPIFIREAAIVFTAPLVSTKASCAAWYNKKYAQSAYSR